MVRPLIIAQWGRRPLTRAQRAYAAADAAVLPAIFDALWASSSRFRTKLPSMLAAAAAAQEAPSSPSLLAAKPQPPPRAAAAPPASAPPPPPAQPPPPPPPPLPALASPSSATHSLLTPPPHAPPFVARRRLKSIIVDVPALLAAHLGRPLPGSPGRSALLAALLRFDASPPPPHPAGGSDDADVAYGGAGKGGGVAPARRGGVLRASNATCLLLTLNPPAASAAADGGAGGAYGPAPFTRRYANAFSRDGSALRLSWFGDGCAEPPHKQLLLFSRLNRGPYVCLGRVAPAARADDAHANLHADPPAPHRGPHDGVHMVLQDLSDALRHAPEGAHEPSAAHGGGGSGTMVSHVGRLLAAALGEAAAATLLGVDEGAIIV